MDAVLPHLRLLTVPANHFDQLSKYLSTSQKSFLAARLMFKDKTSAANVSPSINLSTTTRNQENMIIYFQHYQEQFDKTKMVEVKATDTVEILSNKIEKVYPVPGERWRLHHDGMRLSESKTLSDYDIKQEHIIVLVPPMYGGFS